MGLCTYAWPSVPAMCACMHACSGRHAHQDIAGHLGGELSDYSNWLQVCMYVWLTKCSYIHIISISFICIQ